MVNIINFVIEKSVDYNLAQYSLIKSDALIYLISHGLHFVNLEHTPLDAELINENKMD